MLELTTARRDTKRFLLMVSTALAAGLLTAGCDAQNDEDAVANAAAANEAVEISDPVHDTAMSGTDNVALYSSETLRRYLDGDDAIGRKFELDRVTFASGSSELDASARAQIADVAAVLKDFPTAAITLSGFADPQGTAEANRKLAADRALAVQQALGADGIPDTAVRTVIAGEVGTSVSREKRRVEFMVERR